MRFKLYKDATGKGEMLFALHRSRSPFPYPKAAGLGIAILVGCSIVEKFIFFPGLSGVTLRRTKHIEIIFCFAKIWTPLNVMSGENTNLYLHCS
jgi:hypothetical protein